MIEIKTLLTFLQIFIAIGAVAGIFINIGANMKSSKETDKKITKLNERIDKCEAMHKGHLFEPSGRPIYVRADDFEKFKESAQEFQKEMIGAVADLKAQSSEVASNTALLV